MKRTILSVSFSLNSFSRNLICDKDKLLFLFAFLILEAMFLKTPVGTASPKQCLMLSSSFFRKAFFSNSVNSLSFSVLIYDHSKDSGIDNILINSLIENTLLSDG